jgi:hypothetical protein
MISWTISTVEAADSLEVSRSVYTKKLSRNGIIHSMLRMPIPFWQAFWHKGQEMCNLRKGIISNSTVWTLEKPNEQATGKLKVRGGPGFLLSRLLLGYSRFLGFGPTSLEFINGRRRRQWWRLIDSCCRRSHILNARNPIKAPTI